MNTQKYKLSFIPLFEEDLNEITDYIANHLQNPDAAHRLVDDIEIAINKRLEAPLAFAPYQFSEEKTAFILSNQRKELFGLLCCYR